MLCDGGVCCLCSPSLEESTSSPSEPEDVIDLVQPAPGAGEAKGLPEETQAAGEGEAQASPGTWFAGVCETQRYFFCVPLCLPVEAVESYKILIGEKNPWQFRCPAKGNARRTRIKNGMNWAHKRRVLFFF